MARARLSKPLIIFSLVPMLSGCVATALHDVSDSVAGAILDQNDVAIVREGLPAYLLMIDGLIEKDPDDAGLLVSGAKLYAFYGAELIQNSARSRNLTEKARGYAGRALCLKQSGLCNIDQLTYEAFRPALKLATPSTSNELYTYGLAWTAWLKVHRRDWNAIAEQPKIEALFEKVLELDESVDYGRSHYYLGILRSQLSPALGGKPELAKNHFDRALELSHGQDLAVRVALARYYARLIYDQNLHDKLLQEVLEADPNVSGLTLSNTMAQREARQLLKESSSYFQE
ncbi:MAG: TRAP transporter TatT component family protein [Gammaproteobacteria bacterium]